VKTLWVEASPKQQASLSSAAAEAVLDAASHDAVGEVERYSVWSDHVVHFGAEAAFAKFAPLQGEQLTAPQQEIWNEVLAEIDYVRSFDRLIISTPMWNWSIPHALKAWIDVIVQPMASSTLDANGSHVGTLGEGKPCLIIVTRSSAYDGRHPELADFQLPYLEFVFSFLGFRVDTLVIEPTTQWTSEARAQFRAQTLERARMVGSALSAEPHGDTAAEG